MPFGSSRRLRLGTNTTIAFLAFAGVLIFVGLIIHKYPQRIDLTKTGTQSISEETRKVLGALDRDVHAIAFPTPSGNGTVAMRDLLENYHVENQRFTYETVDADRNPAKAKQYEVTNYDTTVLSAGTKTQRVTDPTEEAITNGLRQLMQDDVRKVYFTAGHGEHPLEGEGRASYSAARKAIEGANFPVAPLTLMAVSEIPGDAGALIVAGPKNDFLPAEIEMLGDYVRGGGSLLVMLDPGPDGGLRDLLTEFGVTLGDDMVIDKISRVFGGDYATPVVTSYGASSFVRDFRIATFFPEARSVRPAESPSPGVTAEPLASTSEAAWGETNMEEIKAGQIAFTPGEDYPGPVALAVEASIAPEGAGDDPPEGEARNGKVIVFGDSDFASDFAFSLSGNADLFLNAIEYLARSDNPIVIERRQQEGAPLVLSAAQGRTLTFVSLGLGPGLVILTGTLVWRSRRKYR